MNRPEMQALLFRMGAAFPGPRLTELEADARIEEWLDSPIEGVPVELATEAWRDWKTTRDRQPTVHEFLEQTRATAARVAPARPELVAAPEERVDPELVAEALASYRAGRRVPDEGETADVEVGGVRVYRQTAERLAGGET